MSMNYYSNLICHSYPSSEQFNSNCFTLFFQINSFILIQTPGLNLTDLQLLNPHDITLITPITTLRCTLNHFFTQQTRSYYSTLGCPRRFRCRVLTKMILEIKMVRSYRRSRVPLHPIALHGAVLTVENRTTFILKHGLNRGALQEGSLRWR